MYGVASRSALITWSSVERNVISPLQADGFSITVVSFDLRIGGSLIDGVNACRSSDVVRCNVCEVDEQARLDLELAHKMEEFRRREPRSYRLFSICNSQWARRQYTGTGMSCFNNSLRQLHMENRVAAHLKSHGAQYDVAVALSVDYYVATPIRLQHVHEAASANASSNPTVYVTSVNDSGGYTDGFYIGLPSTLARVMGRFIDSFDIIITGHSAESYERLLKSAFLARGVLRRTTPLVFFKVH